MLRPLILKSLQKLFKHKKHHFNMLELKTRLEFWRFIQDVEYDIRVTQNKEIWNKHEMIAIYKPE